MTMPSYQRLRRGAVAVEAAMVYPVLMFLMLTLVIGAVGVFHYQQVAAQAREAARWSAVRGSDWSKETDLPSPTRDQIVQQTVMPLAASMDQANLSVRIDWINGADGTAIDWDTAPRSRFSQNAANQFVANRVRVTVTYQWLPQWLGIGPVRLHSVSEIPMAF